LRIDDPSPFVAKVMDVSGAGQFLDLRATTTATAD
jgi:hypothetical protein